MLHLTKQEGTMPINDNLARVMRRFKRKERLSVQALSERLGLTKSSAQIYLKGEGNPRADTLELLAEGCGVSMMELVSDPLPGGEQAETVAQAARMLGGLPPERREACVEHLLAVAAIFAESQDG